MQTVGQDLMEQSRTMSQPDELRDNVLDAVALLTDKYGDSAAFDGKLLFEVAGPGGDFEVNRKLLGLLGGMTVVTRTLLEYGADAVGDEDDNALTDLAADAGNKTVLRQIRELTTVAARFVDFCAQHEGTSPQVVLTRLGEDLNWLDED